MKMIVDCVTASGEEVGIEMVDLIFRQGFLCGGRLVPPRNLVKEFLLGGVARYDHWREITWVGFLLTDQQYDQIKLDLMSRYECKFVECSNEEHDRFSWEAVQTAEQTGKSISYVLPVMHRLNMYQKMLDVMRDASETIDVDDDLWTDISLRLSEEMGKLQ